MYPLSNLVATQQIETGDFVMIDFDTDREILTFRKQSGKLIVNDGPEEPIDDTPIAVADAAGVPMPGASAAPQMSKIKGEDPREA